MPGNDLEPLTNTPAGFSVDVYPTSFTPLWVQDQFSDIEDIGDIEETASEIRVNWQRLSSSGSSSYGIELPAQGAVGQQPNWRAILERSLCHLILDFLPDSYLQQVKQSLFDIVELYSHENVLLQSPDIRQLPAKISGRYDREPAILDED